MTKFAVKTGIGFEPAANVDLGSVAVGYATPSGWRHTLGGMAIINGLSAKLRYKLARSGGAGAVDIEIRVKTGSGTVLHTETLNVAAGATVTGVAEVDVGAVSGGAPLLVDVNVTTADAGTSATLDTDMLYETPVVVSGC